MRCLDCNGKGSILLLTSTSECLTCGGTGNSSEEGFFIVETSCFCKIVTGGTQHPSTEVGIAPWGSSTCVSKDWATLVATEYTPAQSSHSLNKEEELVDYVSQQLLKLQMLKPNEDGHYNYDEINFISLHHIKGPVTTYILNEMMSEIEQQGLSVVAFISSSTNFKDIRNMATEFGMKWEGTEVTYLGIPIWHSHKIPSQGFVAVSTDNYFVSYNITG